jgi:hypothetical protein
MTQQAEAFIQNLMDGPSLRADFQRAPEETARRAGLDLSNDDLKALRSVDWGDEQLMARVSRRGVIGECAPSDVNLKEHIVPIVWDD